MARGYNSRSSASTSDDDVREIWLLIRGWIGILRVLLIISIIIIAEIFEEAIVFNLSLSVWAIVVGFPLFLLMSIVIIQGDKRFAPDLEDKRRERVRKRS
jgi:hypothetical protein